MFDVECLQRVRKTKTAGVGEAEELGVASSETTRTRKRTQDESQKSNP